MPNYTMERMTEVLRLLREKHRFNGYIHVKAIPGADSALVRRAGLLADRMSVNIELPSEDSLKKLAPDKKKEKHFAADEIHLCDGIRVRIKMSLPYTVTRRISFRLGRARR